MPLFTQPPQAGEAANSHLTERIRADIVIIGSGMGGGTLFWALRNAGVDVLLVERGTFLPRERQNSDADEVFRQGRYRLVFGTNFGGWDSATPAEAGQLAIDLAANARTLLRLPR